MRCFVFYSDILTTKRQFSKTTPSNCFSVRCPWLSGSPWYQQVNLAPNVSGCVAFWMRHISLLSFLWHQAVIDYPLSPQVISRFTRLSWHPARMEAAWRKKSRTAHLRELILMAVIRVSPWKGELMKRPGLLIRLKYTHRGEQFHEQKSSIFSSAASFPWRNRVGRRVGAGPRFVPFYRL